MSNGRLSDNAIKVATSRYFMAGEDWESCVNRVAHAVSIVENSHMTKYASEFGDIVYDLSFLPAGRIIRNAGRQAGSMFNCYHLPIGDSRKEIGQFYSDSLMVWGEGGGLGVNFSSLRPEDAPIKGVGGRSSGPVSFLAASNGIAHTIKSGGQRHAAGLALMSVLHPDILKFIDAKLKDGVLSCYDISVAVTDDFLEAVESDSEWEFKFAQKSYGKIKAREIWDKVIINMVQCGEPGLLNWNNLIKNNSYYYDPIVGTNPCQPSWATVLTCDGISTIGDLRIGDEIWSEDGPVTVVNKVSSGIKDVYRYRTTAGVFYGTEDHRVVSGNKKVKAKDAVSIDILRGPTGKFLNENIDVVDVIDGLVIGDGSTHEASNNLVFLCIGQDDGDYFESEIKDHILEHRPGIKNTAYVVNTTVKHDELPLTYNRKVPSRFKFGNRRRVSGFLRGLFSANGSVLTGSGSKRVQLKAASLEIIEDAQIMLSSLGIKSYITINKPKEVEFANGTYECKKSYDLNITVDTIMFEFLVGFVQDYKNKALAEINLRKSSGRDKIEFNIIEKIYISTEEVFDITVGGDSHTYWSGGCNVSNCGEAALEPYGVCDLGSLVLPSFITGTVNTNWKKLEEVIRTAVRFLDNVTDVNKYVLEEIDIKAHNSRRVGIGVMGLADYLFAKKLKYGSRRALVEVERLFRFVRDAVYQSLVELAVEKGAFPKFDPIAYGKASFIRKLPASLRMDIKDKGVRCVSGMAIAPTGTISLIADVTSGVEPLFRKAYMRSDRVSERMYVHDIYKDIMKKGYKTPKWYVDTDDLKPSDHFETQALIQKYVDGAVSKTINMPKGTTAQQLSKLTLEYINDLKGMTVYVDGSKKDQILNKVTKKEVEKHLKEGKVETVPDEESVQCATGNCEI